MRAPRAPWAAPSDDPGGNLAAVGGWSRCLPLSLHPQLETSNRFLETVAAANYLRHNDVVKMVGLEGAVAGTPGGVGLSAAPAQAPAAHQGSERGTRARIARLILEHGPATAAGLSTRLGLTPAAIRRHLDNLLADGMIEARQARCYGSRGGGRPARLFAITDPGPTVFEHGYDALATSALRFLAET